MPTNTNRIVTAFVMGMASLAVCLAQAQNSSRVMGETARRQFAALLEEKSRRTPGERKMDSHLVHAAKMFRGQRIHADYPAPPDAMAGAHVDAAGQVEIDLNGDVTAGLLAAIRNAGGTIESALAGVAAFAGAGALAAGAAAAPTASSSRISVP